MLRSKRRSKRIFFAKKMLSFGAMLLLAAASVFSQTDTARVFSRVEQMPFFAGCEHLKNDDPRKRACSDSSLVAFISKQLYCLEDTAGGLVGTLVVSFVVDEEGRVAQDSVLRGNLKNACRDGLKTALRKMPRWEPGIHVGKKAKVRLTMPIRFSAQSSSDAGQQNYSIHWGQLRGDKVSKATLLKCLNEPLLVRDEYGNSLYIVEVVFTQEKNGQEKEARSAKWDKDEKVKKLIQKTPTGSMLTIAATIPIEGRFAVVEKTVLVEE